MSIHQFPVDGRKRLVLSPSKTEPGKVVLQVLDSARDVLLVCSMDATTAAVVAQAFDLEAAAAECLAQSVRLAGGLAAAVSGARPVQVKTEVGGCDCSTSWHAGQFKPPCICHTKRLQNFRTGGPVLSALPVRDVAQVGA